MRTDGVSAVATQPLPGKACHCRCSRMLVMMYRVVIKRVLTAAAGSNIGVMTHGMHREQQAE